ncbi:MAG: glycosyltransferase [bacterium]|nr:glycosyltransferase [bacterium]
MKPDKNRPVIITIPTWNRADLLKNCIESIFENTKTPYYRICVFDQASTDGTKEYLESLGNKVDVIYSPENIGFVLSMNQVMRTYAKNDILLLNNDTLVHNGWLEGLIECAYSSEDIGIVAPKFIYPTGVINEAGGGNIFRYGATRNIGRGDNPDKPKYNHQREIDYSSGACMYIKRSTLDRTGEFDELFCPCYFEDVDLCFRSREVGLRVMYQPKSLVTHIEGGTAGTDVKSGMKKYQEVNREKFINKWEKVLSDYKSALYKVPSEKEQILIIAEYPPWYDASSGGLRLYQKINILKKYYDVVFIVEDLLGYEKYVDKLEELDVAVFHCDLKRHVSGIYDPLFPEGIQALLTFNKFKLVSLEFYNVADRWIDFIRKFSPQSVTLLDSHDVHFMRELRKAEIAGVPSLFRKAAYNKIKELATYEKMDVVTTVCETDREALLTESPNLDIRILPNTHKIAEDVPGRENRKDILFVGGFLHTPNVDAVLYFCKEIFPLIKKKLPDIKFFIVGNAPPPEVRVYESEDIIVTGYVPDTKIYLDSCCISVAPLTYGAGMKGKVTEALANGIPVVTTSIGAEGIGIENGKHALIADTPESFAENIIKLYNDKELWEKLSCNGKALIKDNYSVEMVEKRLVQLGNTLPEPKEKYPERFKVSYGSSLLSHLLNELTIIFIVTEDNEVSKVSIENLLINSDDKSSDILIATKSEKIARELERDSKFYIKYENEQELDNITNYILQNLSGKYIAILDSSVIVSLRWDKHLINHLNRKKDAGIVIPSSLPFKYNFIYEFENDVWENYKKYRNEKTVVQNINVPCMIIKKEIIPKECKNLQEIILGIINKGYKIIEAKDTAVWHIKPDLMDKIKVKFTYPEEKLLSVVIPSYNNKEILLKCIDSFANQDGINSDDLEIIVVDDGSTDGTIDAIKGLKVPCDFKHYVQSHKSQSAATNKGIQEAKGKFILLSCQDVIAKKDLIKQHLNTHQEYSGGNVVVLGYIQRHSEIEESHFINYIENRDIQFAYESIESSDNVEFRYFYAPNVSLRRKAFEEAGLFDESLKYGWQDSELGLRLTLNKYRIVYNADAIVYHYHKQELKSYIQRQVKVGESFGILSYKCPHTDMWSLEEAKRRCLCDFYNREELVKYTENIVSKLEQLSEKELESYKFSRDPLLETCYALILNYYYAKGIDGVISWYEGKDWIKKFIEEKEMKVEKINKENDALKYLIESAVSAGEVGFKKAIENVIFASKLIPNSPLPYYFLGEYYLKLEKYQEAENSFKNGIERIGTLYPEVIILPQEEEAYYYFQLAMVFMQQKNFNKPIKILEKLISEGRLTEAFKKVIAYKILSTCYRVIGEKDKSIRFAQESERLNREVKIIKENKTLKNDN